MTVPVSGDVVYILPDGRLSAQGLILFREIIRRMDAIAAVPAPTGGATVDAEARAAVAAIVAGAG